MNNEVNNIIAALTQANSNSYGQSTVPEGFFSEPKPVEPIANYDFMPTSSGVTVANASVDDAVKDGWNPAVDINSAGYGPDTQGRAGIPAATKRDVKPAGIGGSDDGIKEVSLTAKQIKSYVDGTAEAMKAISSLTNGYISQIQGVMKGRSYDFAADQNERNAEILVRNQRDILRASQADANVFKVQQAKIKSAQKVAQAEGGFAVGKGINRTTLDTTDARTNYNVAAMMLKAELQNAEITRQIGAQKAQAIINRADAEAARTQGKIAKEMGIINSVSQAFSSAANFYIGYTGLNENA